MRARTYHKEINYGGLAAELCSQPSLSQRASRHVNMGATVRSEMKLATMVYYCHRMTQTPPPVVVRRIQHRPDDLNRVQHAPGHDRHLIP